MLKKIIKWTILGGALALLAACGSNDQNTRLRISVIPKATSHEFWQSVHAGAIRAGKELDVEVVWIGPEKEDDRQQQIALIDNQVMNQVDGIVLAPLDKVAVLRPVKNAVTKNVPVIIYDSNLEGSEDIRTSFVATNNREGGRIAGEQLGNMLNGSGKVVLLRYLEGSASTTNREAGFLEALQKFPDIELVSDEQYAGVTVASAQQASENLLLRFTGPDGKLTIDGIFCPNESSTYGMLQALRRQRLGGTVTFVGFDVSESLIEGLESRDISGLVVQNPFKMGYIGVKTMVQHLKGEPVEKIIDTGVAFVTPENMNEPAMQELIKPDLDKWLNMQ